MSFSAPSNGTRANDAGQGAEARWARHLRSALGRSVRSGSRSRTHVVRISIGSTAGDRGPKSRAAAARFRSVLSADPRAYRAASCSASASLPLSSRKYAARHSSVQPERCSRELRSGRREVREVALYFTGRAEAGGPAAHGWYNLEMGHPEEPLARPAPRGWRVKSPAAFADAAASLDGDRRRQDSWWFCTSTRRS